MVVRSNQRHEVNIMIATRQLTTTKDNVALLILFLWMAAYFPWTSTAFLMKSPVQPFVLQKIYRDEQQGSQIGALKYKSSVYEDVNIQTENSTFIPAPNVPVAAAAVPTDSQQALTTTTTTSLPLDDSLDSSSSLPATYSPMDVWATHVPTSIQGGSIRTWTFETSRISTVQVHLKTDGRPMNANGMYNIM
jgi:hypothetical protein